MLSPEENLKKYSKDFPPIPKPGGIYSPVIISGKMLYVSGQVPLRKDGIMITGKVGMDMTMEEARSAARQTGLTMLVTIRDKIEDLNKIKRLVKTLGMVNCTFEFDQQPQVINGFSELMCEIFGEEHGKGARSAVGMILPGGAAVEIEAIFELH